MAFVVSSCLFFDQTSVVFLRFYFWQTSPASIFARLGLMKPHRLKGLCLAKQPDSVTVFGLVAPPANLNEPPPQVLIQDLDKLQGWNVSVPGLKDIKKSLIIVICKQTNICMNLRELLWPHIHKCLINYSTSTVEHSQVIIMRKFCISSEHLFLCTSCLVDTKCLCVSV